MSAKAFRKELSARNARVVLTYTNVVESLPRSRAGSVERQRAIELVAEMETLPIAYLRQPDLVRREFRQAIGAYETNGSVPVLDPYVNEWWETFSKTPSEFVSHLKPAIYAAVHGSTLSEQVGYLLAAGDDLVPSAVETAAVVEAMRADRAAHGSRRGVLATWVSAVERQFLRFGWSEPAGGIEAFAAYLKNDSGACPAWRLGVALYEEFRSNITTEIRPGDIPDFSHVHFLPYVTHATLDRAWRDRSQRARKRLEYSAEPITALDRVYPDIESILASW